MTKRKTVVIIVAALLTAGAAIFLYGMGDPASGRLYPKCPFHLLTGLECPGCGSQRAIHCLLNGEFAMALHYNALIVIAIPCVLLCSAAEIASRTARHGRLYRFMSGIRRILCAGPAIYVILAVILLFWIFRNFSAAF